jgi:hypothetical protein
MRFIKGLALALIPVATVAALAGTASAADSTPKANGSVTWDYQGVVTGSVTFNANNKTGGSLDYQANDGHWLHATINPGSYMAGANHSALFTGVITSGSPDYLVTPAGAANPFIVLQVVDGGTSGRNGDRIAVYANERSEADAATTTLAADNSGVVTSGNLTIF